MWNSVAIGSSQKRMFPVRLSWCVVLENLLNFSEHCLSLRKKKKEKVQAKYKEEGYV